MGQHQHTAFLIQPITPTEVLMSRVHHRNGVNWVFHDPVIGNARHVNVPYTHPSAQQLNNQLASQQGTTNEMVLYQQPSNQMAQPVPQIASTN